MGKKVPAIIYAVVLLLMVWIGFDFYETYTSSATTEPPQLALEEVSPSSPEPRRPFAHYAVIGERNPFCRECADGGAESSTGAPTDSQPQDGTLAGKLRLRGTAIAQNGESYVVLEHVATRVQELYKTGDVAEEAEIIKIEPNQVTVRYGEKVEVLAYIPEEPPERAAAQQQPQTPAQRRPRGGYFGRTISRDDVGRCAQTIDSLLASAGAEAFAKSGEPYGVRLARVDVRSCLGRLGLRSGDIILSVNDQAVTSISDAADAVAGLADAQSSRFRVDRNGWPRSFNIQIQ